MEQQDFELHFGETLPDELFDKYSKIQRESCLPADKFCDIFRRGTHQIAGVVWSIIKRKNRRIAGLEDELERLRAERLNTADLLIDISAAPEDWKIYNTAVGMVGRGYAIKRRLQKGIAISGDDRDWLLEHLHDTHADEPKDIYGDQRTDRQTDRQTDQED